MLAVMLGQGESCRFKPADPSCQPSLTTQDRLSYASELNPSHGHPPTRTFSMIKDLGKIWAIFTPPERRKAVVMLVLIVLMAVAETGSVLSIMPFLSVLGRPAVIHENAILQSIYSWFDFHTNRDFMIALGLVSIATVIGASVFKTITLHLTNRFIHLLRRLSAQVTDPRKLSLTSPRPLPYDSPPPTPGCIPA